MGLKEKLLRGDKRICVWGCGFIGYTTLASFALNGVKGIGIDIDEGLVSKINQGEIALPNLSYWLGFDVKPLAESGMISATTDWKKALEKDIAVSFVAIPTEKDGEPYDAILEDVIKKIAGFKDVGAEEPHLVIIESTLTPGRNDAVVIPLLEKAGLKIGEDILLGVAPRRDWFISQDKSLKKLPRVIGGTNPETTELMKDVLSVVCDTLVPAPDHKHAEIVKSIENAYRHADITLANQLSLAYPDVDMEKVLKLVGTKWNIGTYYPSFGTGGYCIPLASQYVLLGADHPEKLTILEATIKTDNEQPAVVAESIAKRGAKNVGILGLSYKGDLKVCILSPTIKIAKELVKRGVEVKVNDPYYTPEEIKREAGTDTFRFPLGLSEFDTILIVADHKMYRFTQDKEILDSLKNCKLIMDNTGIWKDIDFSERGIKYHLAGDKGWLG